MKLTFKVKINKDGSFNLPVAEPKHSDQIRHMKAPIQFRIDCKKAVRSNESIRKLLVGGVFNIESLPPEITIDEIKFISEVEVNF